MTGRSPMHQHAIFPRLSFVASSHALHASRRYLFSDSSSNILSSTICRHTLSLILILL